MHEFDTYKNYINSGDVVYDIGAHVGEMSRMFADKGAHVYAFEPSKNNMPRLLGNVGDNKNVTVFNVALGEKNYDCVTQFKDCSTDYIDETGRKQDTEQEISYVNLQDFMALNKLPNPHFIKMDIEGMESVVMNSMTFLLEGARPIFYIEIHAKPRNLDIQDYEDNPHWKWPDQGGFDFDTFKNYHYAKVDPVSTTIEEGSFNPREGEHKGYLFIPLSYVE